jgi:hypothetical protein
MEDVKKVKVPNGSVFIQNGLTSNSNSKGSEKKNKPQKNQI